LFAPFDGIFRFKFQFPEEFVIVWFAVLFNETPHQEPALFKVTFIQTEPKGYVVLDGLDIITCGGVVSAIENCQMSDAVYTV
jgi:hypothetical protein